MKSFRVTIRPSRYGGITMGAQNGRLIVAAAYLPVALLRRLGGA